LKRDADVETGPTARNTDATFISAEILNVERELR